MPIHTNCEHSGATIHDRRRAIITAQIDAFKPDVVYVFEWSPLGDAFLTAMKRDGRLIVGEIASPLPANRTFRSYDLMMSSLPQIVDHFRRRGMHAEHLRLGFDARVLRRIRPQPAAFNVSFVGGFAPSHPDRIPWLEGLLGEVEIDVFCYGLEQTSESSPIRKHFGGQVWGRRMYETLQQSRITLNRHAWIEVDGRPNTEWCNNMRMYEATGMETCLLTEKRSHLADLFEPDREVATYGSTAECAEKIRHLLEHESERAAIAAVGQQRTLREHTYAHRMAKRPRISSRQRNSPPANARASQMPM
ncbi:MAG: glycosyltransferase [Planctomycetes bacterium]|nr:glycosyltransferase [Planctomycetota bacterium]